MINTYKSNKKNPFLNPIAGAHPADSSIEFFGCLNDIKNDVEVFWMQNGSSRSWRYLSDKNYQICNDALLSDKIAYAYLTENFPSISENRKTELYIYALYGHLDNTPDMIDGILQPSENFRISADCPSFGWSSKWFTLNGKILTRTEIDIIDCINIEMPDKMIASVIDKSHSYLDQLKRNLFVKAGVSCKSGLMRIAVQEKII